ncbi:Rieske (2Fe-2S) protein [Pseudomonas plecoglossicida]|uniref:Rieske (2Fe-2S) protein n=1 Tax=Pseudomonas plecoglossicida TaxID=70775 RepID=UPI003D1B208C
MGCVALCQLDALGEGQARGFDPQSTGADSLFALRHRGQVRVYRNLCPHLLVPLEYRKDRFLSADGQWVVCYAHGARFRPEDGACVHGPCRGEALQALTHQEVDGWLLLPLAQLER